MAHTVKSGTVYLVGAGPGDPELITVRGLRLLQQADVVAYDRLVHPDLVEEAHPAARRVFVGKAADRPSCPQEDINALLVEEAQRGSIVVRLKGGDPFVFGRGGEEALALREADVPFEIVPGISSAVSAPAYAGIPVTHRGRASAFTVVTGHTCRPDADEELDWTALAQTGTLVVLMGLKRLPGIADTLLDHGRAPETPAAAIQSASTADQQVVTGTLANIAERAQVLSSPTTVVIGEVARLGQQLAWFTPRHLHSAVFPEEGRGDAIPASETAPITLPRLAAAASA